MFDLDDNELHLTFSRPVVPVLPLDGMLIPNILSAAFEGDTLVSNVGNVVTVQMSATGFGSGGTVLNYPAGQFAAADNGQPVAAAVAVPVTVS